MRKVSLRSGSEGLKLVTLVHAQISSRPTCSSCMKKITGFNIPTGREGPRPNRKPISRLVLGGGILASFAMAEDCKYFKGPRVLPQKIRHRTNPKLAQRQSIPMQMRGFLPCTTQDRSTFLGSSGARSSTPALLSAVPPAAQLIFEFLEIVISAGSQGPPPFRACPRTISV